MKKIMIRVAYQGYDEGIDQKITKSLESAGLEFTGQGYNHITGERDICFELEVY